MRTVLTASLLVLAVNLALPAGIGLVDAAQSTAAPPAWSPPSAPSPLHEIWSFDTKG